jgi:hypothetical protein
MLARLFQKHGNITFLMLIFKGGLNSKEEVSLEDMQRISETLRDRENLAIQQAMQKIEAEKTALSDKEIKIENLETKLKGLIQKKKEQIESVE